ncbi:MAG: hypothetical protein QGG36_10725 [Pirellulaceae bacterium]|jgi:hypothetical protein|nr:hypothetical protein [Pirellulaceae bacterium]
MKHDPKAREAFTEQLAALVDKIPAMQRHGVAGQLLKMGEKEKALGGFQSAFEEVTAPREKCFNGLFVVILAHELKKQEIRDAAFAELAKVTDESQQGYVRMSQLIRQFVDKRGEVTTKEIEQLADQAKVEENQVNLSYFGGKLLLMMGRTAEGQRRINEAVVRARTQTYLTTVLAKAEQESLNKAALEKSLRAFAPKKK